MIIYKDRISGDEVLSDSYRITDDGFLLKVIAKYKTESYGISDSMIGGNASAEEVTDTGTDDTAKREFDIILAHGLVETGFTKKDYQTYIKGYMKLIKEKLGKDSPDMAAEFEEKAKARIKDIMGSFNDYQFFMGKSMDVTGHIALVKSIDADSSEFYFFKYGLIAEKF